MPCAVCSAKVRSAMRRGTVLCQAKDDFIPQKQRPDGSYVEGLCSSCGSRGRTRALVSLFERSKTFVPSGDPVLVCSAPHSELDIYTRCFKNVTHVSLYGDGDVYRNCILGVDLRDLSDFPANHFKHFFAQSVLDFIPELNLVFKELKRVMQPGGTALFKINPVRLGEFEQPVVIKNTNALHAAKYAPELEDGTTGIPDCRFDSRVLRSWITDAGFSFEILSVADHLSDLKFDFYLARSEIS